MLPKENALSILLIEDNPGDARLVMEALSAPWDGQPVSIFTAGSLAAGLEYIKNQQVNAILLDLSLPDSSGEETFHQIFEASRRTPVILLTGMQDDDLVQHLIGAGAQDYLLKGEVDEKTLRRSIRYAMQRKVSEDNLRASEERYRLLIEQASDGIFTTDMQGRFLDVNASGCAILGYSLDEFLQLHMRDLETGDLNTTMQAHRADLAAGKTVLMENELRHKDGHPVPVEISAKILPDGRRQGIIRDITARRQAEAALNQSNEFNRVLIQTLPFLMDIIDEDGRVIYVSPNMAATIYGEAIGRKCWDVHKDNGSQCENCPLKTSIEIGKTIMSQLTDVHGGRTYEVTHTGLIYQGRRALLEIFQDITERKVLEEKLETSLHQLRFHVENSPLAVIEFDKDFNIQTWTGRAEQIFGWQAQEVIGVSLQDIPWSLPGENQSIESYFADVLQFGFSSRTINTRSQHKNGTPVDCEWYFSSQLDEAGNPISIQALVLDVTERNKAEQSLRESEAFGQAILYNSPIGISVLDRSGIIITYNDAWKQIWAFDDGDVIDQVISDTNNLRFASNADYIKPFQAELEKIYQAGGTLHLPELKVPEPRPGAAEWISQHFYALLDEQFEVNKVVVLTEDITERKKAELALLKANASLEQRVIDRTFDLRTANVELQKAARMKDEFLASMSHELRTPLTGILGLSEAMQMPAYGQLTEKQVRALKNIEASGRHLLSLINDILDLSKIEAGMFEMQFSTSSLDAICQSSLQMVKGMANQKHQNYSLSIEPAGINFRTDPRRLKQMLVNLLGNAIKFTADGGSLGIEARGLENSRLLTITVWDTGIGISEEDLPRLFKPFVQLDSSLSRQYAGTGLGLSLVKRLAEMQGGSISVQSSVNGGSRFTIQLPWVEEEALPVMFNRRVSDIMQRTVSIDQNPEDGDRITTLLKLIGVRNRSILADLGAIDLAAQIFPDLVILRMQSHNSSSFEIFNQLKNDIRTQALPILIITSQEFKGQALEMGAAGVLIEPFAQLELFNELQRIASFLQQAGQPEEENLQERADDRNPNLVMLADDNPLIIDLISDFLVSQNLQVSAFKSGSELLANLEIVKPAVVLMDIQMPGMNGLDVIRAIRANPSMEVAGLPIIALTALAMQGDRERCMEAGANEYMSKPLHMQELLDYIQTLRVSHSSRLDF